MAIGLYKPGQGYWVRVLTATLIGVVTLAAAAWAYNETSRVAEHMPRSHWATRFEAGTEKPRPGETVTLLGKRPSEGAAPVMGTAIVESYDNAASELRLNNVGMTDPGQDPSQAEGVRIGATDGWLGSNRFRGEASVDPRLLQGIVMAVVLLLGALLAYYFVAMHQTFVDFLVATDGEMKKVNWSTRKDITKSTMVVIFASVMLAGSLFIIDFVFQWFFTSIGILRS